MSPTVNRVLFFALLGLLIFSLFHRLDYLPLKFEEPRRALVTLEMILSGDYTHPTIYGIPYYNKPPIYNWGLSVLFKVFGTADWVIRLPTVLSLLLIGAIHYLFFRKKIGEEAARWSALFLITSVNIYYYFSFQGELDLFYSLIVYLQVLTIFHFYHRKQYWQLFLWSYVFMGLGFLTKGLPSVGFQGLTLIGLVISERKFRWFFSWQHLVSGILSLVLIAAYFLAYDSSGGQAEYYLAKLFFEGSRRTIDNQESFSFLNSFFSFPLLIAYLLSPWLIFGLFGITRSVLKTQFENPWLRYGLIFLAFNLPLYWLSAGTRDRYLYMFLPFAFLWIYQWVHVSFQKDWWKKVAPIIFGILSLGCLILLFTKYTNYPNVTLAVSLSLIAFAGIGWACYRYDLSVFLGWLAVLIVLRLLFNVLVFEVRHESAIAKEYEASAIVAAEKVADNPLYYYAPLDYEEIVLPILNQSIYFKKVKRLHYVFAYHLERIKGQIIQHSEFVLPGQQYLTLKENLPDQTYQLIHEFELDNQTYCIIQTW